MRKSIPKKFKPGDLTVLKHNIGNILLKGEIYFIVAPFEEIGININDPSWTYTALEFKTKQITIINEDHLEKLNNT